MYNNDIPGRIRKPRKPELGRLALLMVLLLISLVFFLYQMLWSREAQGRELINLFDRTRGAASEELDSDYVAELDQYFGKGYNFYIFAEKPDAVAAIEPRELILLDAGGEPLGTVDVYPLPEGEIFRFRKLYFERR